MTAREIYEAVLVEINKENTPSFTIEEFNYALNKAVLAVVNEKYNFYASNQQLSDDLRVLLKKAIFNLRPENTDTTYNPIRSYTMERTSVGDNTVSVSLLTDLDVNDVVRFGEGGQVVTVTAKNADSYPYTITISPAIQFADIPASTTLYKETEAISTSSWRTELTEDRVIPVTLPASDYLHMLSCRISWRGSKVNSAGDAYMKFPAKRLTFDLLNVIENNTYLRPSANRPYFQVFDNQMNSGVEKLSGDLKAYKAYQNSPRIEVHIGRERVAMAPTMIEIDYLKLPELIVLDDIDVYTAGNDTSQSLELPDYLKNEVVRRIAAYLLEKMGDPRIATQPQLNTEIPSVPINLQQQAAANRQAQNQ